MKNLKTISFGLLLVGISATTLSSCKKDEDETTPASHVTTYTIGANSDATAWVNPSDAQVKASADSTLVSEVDLKSNGLSFGGTYANAIVRKLSPAFATSPKVKGKGNLKDVAIGTFQSDSLQLVAWGYTVNQ
jgi:hypothetical protein